MSVVSSIISHETEPVEQGEFYNWKKSYNHFLRKVDLIFY
ncbi:hypothetical protein HMPREF0018_00524 [Acinetobacter radioresistens SH164]|nr:hypothetical protein HMPREF0018_00524 [Acinetobacter radioresistens SH164]